MLMHIQRHGSACVVSSVLREDLRARLGSSEVGLAENKTWLEPLEAKAHDANLWENRSNTVGSLSSLRVSVAQQTSPVFPERSI